MGVREYLEQREKELEQQILQVRAQMAALQLSLIPLEGELAEVRRAKNAIGGGGITGLPFEQIGEISISPHGAIRPARANLIGSVIQEPPLPLVHAAGSGGFRVTGAGVLTLSNPYEKLTMKELVLKALEEHFQHGATTRKLLDFFRDAWGRNIERTNLSPQLSRLYQDGRIGRAAGYKEWHFMHRRGIGIDDRHKGFVERNTKEVVYMLPEQARPDGHVPILTASDPTPDPDED